MEFDTLSAFLAMGKHGAYVWSAYGLSALIIGLNILWPIWAKKRLVRDIKNQQKREKQHAPTA